MTRGDIETGSAADDFGALIGLARGIEGAAVMAMWDAGQLIRDPYGGAATGEVALTLNYLWGFAVPRASNFARIKFVAQRGTARSPREPPAGSGLCGPPLAGRRRPTDEAPMSERTERRYVELRQAEGRVIEGVAVRYGDVAVIGAAFRERIEAGAFGRVADADVILNAQHDRTTPLARTGGGGLSFADSAESLSLRADLPETRAADDVLALVRSGVLRGLSIEFRAVAERIEAGVRVIERAVLRGVAVVDTPAYPASEVEARMAMLPRPAPARRRLWL